MSTRSTDRNFEAATAKRFGNDTIDASAVDYEERRDSVAPALLREEMTHSTQIAVAFFGEGAEVVA